MPSKRKAASESDSVKNEKVKRRSESNLARSIDYFGSHFETDLEETVADRLLNDGTSCTPVPLTLRETENVQFTARDDKDISPFDERLDLEQCSIRKNLLDILQSNRKLVIADFQCDLMQSICRYIDLLCPIRNQANGEQIRLVYCIHALNHALKTRHRVLQHNSRLKEQTDKGIEQEEYRDQGLTRPKVLILVPFRAAALSIVNIFIQLLFGSNDKPFVTNLKRFHKEYSPDPNEQESLRTDMPDELKTLLSGNVDDCFRIGLGIAKKSLKLYVDFYSADILIASPLGLRMIVGEEGEKSSEFDFLSSIEVLIMDQTDVFLMQNWQHVIHVMQTLHTQPKESHGVDFSRIRMWSLNNWSKLYRQTLVFSAISLPEIKALFSRYCFNYAGLVSVSPIVPETGCLDKILVNLPQAIQRFSCQDPASMSEARFEYFIRHVLPQYKDSSMSHTMIFIPCYYDFVRLRNHLKRESISFVQVCEYSKTNRVSRARDMFFHGRKNLMLFTERFHFFHRYRIRGVQHLIIYQLPIYANFYGELCNMIQDTVNREPGSIVTCTVLYSKYDAMRLAAVVGQERATNMLKSDKKTHMFTTGH